MHSERTSDLTYTDIYNTLYKNTGSPEYPVLKNMDLELNRASWKHARPFYRQIAIEANKFGLSGAGIQYMFWVVFENRKSWPNMGPSLTRALADCIVIAANAGGVPNYSRNLEVPPIDEENLLDKAIVSLANWGSDVLGPALKRDWDRIVANGVKSLPEDMKRKGPSWLDNRFRSELAKHPWGFVHSALLRSIFDLIE